MTTQQQYELRMEKIQSMHRQSLNLEQQLQEVKRKSVIMAQNALEQ